jgi:hypothetical protein
VARNWETEASQESRVDRTPPPILKGGFWD